MAWTLSSTNTSLLSSTASAVCSVWIASRCTPAGYRRLLTWMRGYGRLERVGVEGTGSYGAGLSRHLLEAGVVVLEVTRPNRQERHRNGKDDDSTRSKLRVRCSPGERWRPPRRAAATARRCGCWSVRNAPPSRPGSRRWCSCGI